MKSTRQFFSAVVYIALFALIALGSSGCSSISSARSREATPPKPLHVLFIGNSYTYVNMLPEMLKQMSLAEKQRPLEYRMITPGGSSLEQNWTNGPARKLIAQGGWDYVVLQEQSLRPITNPATMFRYARLFDQDIRNAGAKTVFYLTWPRKQTPEKQALISQSYTSIATELHALACPVGIAWEKVRQQKPELELYNKDGSHPSSVGTYLAAAVFFDVLYGKNRAPFPQVIVGNDDKGKQTVLASLTEDEVQLLQKVATDTVKHWKQPVRQ